MKTNEKIPHPTNGVDREGDIGIIMICITPCAVASHLFSSAIDAGLNADGLEVSEEGAAWGPFWVLWKGHVSERKAGLQSLHRTACKLKILAVCEISWFDVEGFWRSSDRNFGSGIFKRILEAGDFRYAKQETERLIAAVELFKSAMDKE